MANTVSSDVEPPESPLPLAYATTTADRWPIHAVSMVWVVYASLGIVRQAVEWTLMYERGTLSALSPAFVLIAIEVIGYVIGLLSIQAPRSEQRLAMLRASAGVAGGALLAGGLYALWQYGHMAALGRSGGGTHAVWYLPAEGVWQLVSAMQRAVLPGMVYFVAMREDRQA